MKIGRIVNAPDHVTELSHPGTYRSKWLEIYVTTSECDRRELASVPRTHKTYAPSAPYQTQSPLLVELGTAVKLGWM